MPPLPFPRIAVIADPHFHDVTGNYNNPGPGLAVRMLADTARSTRVFNESHFALRHALDDVAMRGIRHVVLLGDYSDDGQIATLEGLHRLLDRYSRDHGMLFYATVGNHDIFGDRGRHRSKRFLNADGSHNLVTSDPRMQDADVRATVVTPKMYCEGYPAGLLRLPDIGFFPRPDDVYWETPFGDDGSPDGRRYSVHSPDGRTVRSLMDCSYLVEPFPGVWLLMIDANVFEPVDGVPPGEDGDLADSTSAGWNAMLRHKRFVLDWMADVSRRARDQGKYLLTFSHYPVLDPLDGTHEDEVLLKGRTGLSERIPHADVAAALMDADIRVHFSGHLHVNDTARAERDGSFVVNVAVPSLVAFPCAYKIIDIAKDRLDITTIGIGDMKHDPGIRRFYDAEIARSGLKPGGMLDSETYGEFLDAHLGHLVGRRHLRREWPRDIASVIHGLQLSDLIALALTKEPVPVCGILPRIAALRTDRAVQERVRGAHDGSLDEVLAASISVLAFLQDWYRLRMGSELALGWISPERLGLYSAVGRLFRAGEWTDAASVQVQFALLFKMYDRYLSGLPSADFSIDLESGAIAPLTS